MNKIAILGPKNTYSDVCFQEYIHKTQHEPTPFYLQSMKQVIDQGESLGYAILPIENTLEGYVQSHMDLLFCSNLHIDSEIKLEIQFDYIYKPNPKRIYVQYVTKNQCLNFLENHLDKTIVLTESNVESYEKYLNDPEGAAIVPRHLVEPIDLVIKGVSDEADNHTRFLILNNQPLGLKLYKNDVPYKVSIVITPKEDRPGLLHEILEGFGDAKINLISIMSRPTKKKMGTYHFFLEFMADVSTQRIVETVLNELKHTFDIRVLGMYQIL